MMRLMLLLIFGLVHLVITNSSVIDTCVPDPCDVCNSQQVCSGGTCSSKDDLLCDGVECGTNAACSQGVCLCLPGYEGDADTECTRPQPTEPEPTEPQPEPTEPEPEPTAEPEPEPTTAPEPEPTPEPTAEPTVAPTEEPEPTSPPGPVLNPIRDLITEDDWNTIFPKRWFVAPEWATEYNSQQPWFYPAMRIDYYSFDTFLEAVERIAQRGFPTFANAPGATVEERKRELCAFFGNIGHETGRGSDGLFYREELGYERTYGNIPGGYRGVGSRTDYRMSDAPVMFRDGSKLFGQVRFTSGSYHGRGPLQLSWGYNYGDYSKFVFGDPQVLLDNPDKVLDEPDLGMGAAIWFWMTQPDWRKSHIPHNVIYPTSSLQPWGFGRTIMAINGGLEYNAVENGPGERDRKVTRRIAGYRRCAAHFGIQVGIDGEQVDTRGLSN